MENLKKFIIILLIVSSSCGKDDPAPSTPNTDPVLQDEFNQFFTDAVSRGKNLSKANLIVKFVDQQDPHLQYYSGSYKEGAITIIALNKVYLDNIGGKYKSSVYRELAHVLLNKQYINGCGASLSHTDIMCNNFCPCEDDGSTWKTSVDQLLQ